MTDKARVAPHRATILVVDEGLGLVIARCASVDEAMKMKEAYLEVGVNVTSNGGATFMAPDRARKVVLAEVME